MSEKTVGDLMHKGLIACKAETPMNEVVRVVSDTDIHAIVVMDGDGHPVGIISHTDIIRLYGQDLSLHRASQVMSKNVIDIEASQPARAAVDKMLSTGVHRLLVVETEGDRRTPVGIISTTDLVKEMRGARWIWYAG